MTDRYPRGALSGLTEEELQIILEDEQRAQEWERGQGMVDPSGSDTGARARAPIQLPETTITAGNGRAASGAPFSRTAELGVPPDAAIAQQMGGLGDTNQRPPPLPVDQTPEDAELWRALTERNGAPLGATEGDPGYLAKMSQGQLGPQDVSARQDPELAAALGAAGQAPGGIPHNPYDPRATAARVETPDPQGGLPDMYGHEDETGFQPEGALAQFQQLAQQRGVPQQRQGPGDYERAAMQNLLSDEDMARVWAIQNIFGQPGAADRAGQIMMQRRAQQQAAIQAARERDMQMRPADRATMEAAVSSGVVTPEAALQMLAGSPIAKSVGNIAPLGVRMRGQDYGMEKQKLGLLGKESLQAQQLQARAEQGAANRETQRDVAQTYAQARGQRNAPVDPQQMLFSHLTGRLGIDPERAREIAADPSADVSDLPRFVQQQIASARGDIAQLSQDPVAARGFMRAGQMQSSGIQKGVTAAQLNPKEREKLQEAYDAIDIPLNNASQAWSVLRKNPQLLNLYVKMGSQGLFGQAAQITSNPEEQAAIGALDQLLAGSAFGQAGKAFTGHERQLVSGYMGVPLGKGFSPFRSPAVLSRYLESLDEVRVQRKKRIESNYGEGMLGTEE